MPIVRPPAPDWQHACTISGVMPVIVTSATQGLPELSAASTSVKNGEGFRESLQQAVEASHAGATAETPVRGKTSTNREGAEKQQNPKHDERERTHTDESTPSAVGSVAVQPPPSVLISGMLPREIASETVVPESLPIEPGTTMVSAEGESSTRRLDDVSGSAFAIAPGQGKKTPRVDTECAGNTNPGVEADAAAEILAMPSRAVEDTASTASPPMQQTVTPPTTVNKVATEAQVTISRMERNAALNASGNNPEIAAQPSKLAPSGTTDVSATPTDINDKSPSQRPEAAHLAGSGHGETAATSAEQFQKSFPLSQVLVSRADSASSDGKTNSVQEAGSADGRAAGHKNLDGGPVTRTAAHGEKDHDQADPSPSAGNSVPSFNSGHTQARATQADGFPAALHTSLNGDAAGGARNANHLDGSNDSTPSGSSPETATAPGHDAPETHLLDGAALPVTVNMGRLVQRIQESEINLNVRSADFGNVAIHTAMSHERVTAQISLEHIDLGKAIAGEVQALQSKLSREHGVQARIEVQQQGQSFSGNGGQQQQSWRQQPAVTHMVATEPSQTDMVPPAVSNDGRLDIRV